MSEDVQHRRFNLNLFRAFNMTQLEYRAFSDGPGRQAPLHVADRYRTQAGTLLAAARANNRAHGF